MSQSKNIGKSCKGNYTLFKHREIRHPANTQIDVRYSGGIMRGRILDLSRTGAKLHQDGKLVVGDRLHLSILYHNIDANVMWIDDHVAGIAFRPKLTDMQFKTLKRV